MPTTPQTQSTTARASRACRTCHCRKIKCSGGQPCESCARSQQTCEYDSPQPRRRKRKASCLAAPPLIRIAPARSSPRPPDLPAAHDSLLDPAEHKRQQEIRTGIGVHESESGAFHFYGPSSHFVFLDRIYQHIDRNGHDGMPKGVRKWKLHHFMFNFRNHHGPLHDSLAEVHIRKELGDSFINEYFKTIHPQIPVLLRSEVEETWSRFWDTPSFSNKPLKGKELVLLVLALGARVSCVRGRSEASELENWAAYFAERADLCSTFMLAPTLKSTHFMLLKAIYAFQLMKQNDAYLYLGYAVKNALTLGLYKSEVVQGNSYSQHRLRTTFWVIYAYERIASCFSGRPSSILDDQIDAGYPDDIVIDIPDAVAGGPCAEFAYVRIQADMGRLANKIASGVYFPKSLRYASDMRAITDVVQECTAELESLVHSLPPFLQFYDTHAPIGHPWQEIQRVFVGMWYHGMHMLMHRPALTYATFFPSRAEARKAAGDLFDLDMAIDRSVASAKSIIHLATEACLRRAPDLKSDGGMAFFLLIGCITLLYDVLDPATTPSYARATFEIVENAIQTLDMMQHVGPNNSKELSLDIMKFAKDALLSGAEEIDWERDLTESFPWLSNVFAEPYTGFPSLPSEPLFPPVQSVSGPTAMLTQPRGESSGITASVADGMHYVSQWPPTSSDVLNVPDSLL